jgi:hypothetical protein
MYFLTKSLKSEATDSGQLPLHLLLARRNPGDMPAVKLLIEMFPESILEDIEEISHIMRVGTNVIHCTRRRWSPQSRAAEERDCRLEILFERQWVLMGMNRLSAFRASRFRFRKCELV